MRINEIIRERRIKQGLTQEQVANYLGVSTPAVNKWEKSISYPDITLLPALARLLETDLNTLLSFQDELTQQEINSFMNGLVSDAKENGVEYAYHKGMEKVREFPSCDSLILNVALTIMGIFTMFEKGDINPSYQNEVEKLYERAATSKIPIIRQQAQSMLISSYMNRQEYDKAEKLIDSLPDDVSYTCDKKHLQAKLCVNLEKYQEAAELMESKLLTGITTIQSDLIMLMEIAIKENRIEDAIYIADVQRQSAKLFDQWEYNQYVAQFGLSIVQKDARICISILRKMLPAMLKKWNMKQSPLYGHIKEKDSNENTGELFLTKILEELENPNSREYDFLHKAPEFQKFLIEFKNSMYNIVK